VSVNVIGPGRIMLDMAGREAHCGWGSCVVLGTMTRRAPVDSGG
jgi:hypothetical protein